MKKIIVSGYDLPELLETLSNTSNAEGERPEYFEVSYQGSVGPSKQWSVIPKYDTDDGKTCGEKSDEKPIPTK